MKLAHRKAPAWFVAATVLILLAVAAPVAAAAGTELRAAPLSPEFDRYQAAQEMKEALGLDRLTGVRRGLTPAPMDISYLAGRRVAPPSLTYASSFDLRSQGKVSPVKDQGVYGTCWTFATFASLESCLLPGELRDFSEDNLALTAGFDVGGDPYDHGGQYWMSSAYLARWGGPVDESQDAYGDSYTPPGLAPVKHVQEIQYIPGGTSGTDTSNIKYALTTYGAVATSISWQDSAYREDTTGFYYSGTASTNHAVTIVGWDDTYAATSFASAPPGNGAWLVRNSWGTGWGQGGYFWVSYFDSYCGRAVVRNAVFNDAQPVANYSDIYQYDPLGEVNTVGYGTTTWGANVFTARGSQSISAVGFFAVAPGTTYTVYAGNALASLQERGSGSFATPGFHTVSLSSPLAVTSGAKFVVAVRLTTPGYNYPLAVEYAEPGYSSAAGASPGQSFISATGASWQDLTTAYDSTANMCLKAYASAGAPPPTDMEPPHTTASGWDDAWHSTPVTVTFSARDNDGGSDVAYTEYQLDALDWKHGTSVTLPAEPDTVHTWTIKYRSVDNAGVSGNVETYHTCQVKIDTSADSPALMVDYTGALPDSHYRTNVTLTLTATGGSSIAAIVYSLDGVPHEVGGASAAIPFFAVPNGVHTLVYHTRDVAGHEGSDRSFKITMDTGGPLGYGHNASVRRGNYVRLRYKFHDAYSPSVRSLKMIVKTRSGRTIWSKSLSTVKMVDTWSALRWRPNLRGTFKYYVTCKDKAGNVQARRAVGTIRVL